MAPDCKVRRVHVKGTNRLSGGEVTVAKDNNTVKIQTNAFDFTRFSRCRTSRPCKRLAEISPVAMLNVSGVASIVMKAGKASLKSPLNPRN